MEEQKEVVLKFELTQNEANIVLAGLGKLPAEASMQVILKLQQQAAPQFAAQSPEIAPATE